MHFTAGEMAKILELSHPIALPNLSITKIRTDSRSFPFGKEEIFVALKGKHHDGHAFIGQLEKKGVRNFIVSKLPREPKKNINYFVVKNTLGALHQLAKHHLQKYDLLKIGITGSNGKTICKTWLNQLLMTQFKTIASPKSYNSQVGVPLSLLQVEQDAEIGIFEAGISEKNEMIHHAEMMKPELGIFTNLGDAHAQNFASDEEKLIEKLTLFQYAETIIYPYDDSRVGRQIEKMFPTKEKITWGKDPKADYQYLQKKDGNGWNIEIKKGNQSLLFFTTFGDEASLKNITTCVICCLKLGLEQKQIQVGLDQLQPVKMRMEKRAGSNNCQLLIDAYNADLDSLSIALNELEKSSNTKKRTLVLSTFDQNSQSPLPLVAAFHKNRPYHKILLIGKHQIPSDLESVCMLFDTTEQLLRHLSSLSFENEVILIKGARRFSLEKISKALSERSNQTIFEINLNALENNLEVFRSKLSPKTKLMVMVKAFAYGSGSHEISQFLSQKNIDYLAVAHVDEGIALRKSGIQTPIMVLSTQKNQLKESFKYDLEPVVFSLSFLQFLKREGKINPKNIHLELNTGMNRLGLNEDDISLAIKELQGSGLEVKSVFSHMAQSEIPNDYFGHLQIQKFTQMAGKLESHLSQPFLKHLCNSMGIVHYPQAHFDMVRLGLGLYGLAQVEPLKNIGILKSYINQLRLVKKGEGVGYGQKGKTKNERKIAIVPIGYADGYSRRFSHGKGYFIIHGKRAPIVGNICMDMTMCDVSQIDCQEGDEVFIYHSKSHFLDLSNQIETIPYELISTISQRVPRSFILE